MAKPNTAVQRIDNKFEKDMKEIARIRITKGLAKLNPKDVSIAEMTRLLIRTNGYRLSLDELKIKPKKEDLKW